MWHSFLDESVKPEPGRAIVAIYLDGSGSVLFRVSEDGLHLHEGGDTDIIARPSVANMIDCGYGLWAHLPKGTKLWHEQLADAAAI